MTTLISDIAILSTCIGEWEGISIQTRNLSNFVKFLKFLLLGVFGMLGIMGLDLDPIVMVR